MRGSPIRGLNGVSPFKSSVILRSDRLDLLQSSPDRLNSNLNDAEYWRTKAKHFEAEFLAVSEELLFNSRRVQRTDELEEKIDLLLRQNNHLVEQNETLLQVIQQKKLQNDNLRIQLDAGGVAFERQTRRANANINILDQQHKNNVERLLAQITRLQDQIQEIEKLKKIEIDGIKSKYQAQTIQQIQNLRRSQQGNNELLELNIRNLKDTVEEKNLEIQRLKKESKLDAERAAGQSSFLRNQIKKIEQQEANKFQLYQIQRQNNANNLNRAHKKNQQEMKNLYEGKIKRLGYDIQQKKNEIAQSITKFRRTGKQSQQEIALLMDDKSKLRTQYKDLDTLRLKQLEELTNFYDNQINNLNKNAEAKEDNTRKLLEDEIDRLRKIIQAKQAQNTSLMQQIQTIKENENIKITNLTNEKDELEKKFKQMVLHYQRQIELLKIKTAKLYESDLDALRKQLQNQLSLLASENGKLKESLQQSRDHLVSELEQKVLMRRDYQTRLRQMNLKYEREHQQLNDLILMAEKKFQNAQSATSLRDIDHTAKTKKQHTTFQGIFAEKRNLENQIANKNKQIQTLNLRIQKMVGFHEKQIADLEKRHAEDTQKFQQSLNSQSALLKVQVEHQFDLQKKNKQLHEKFQVKQKEWNDKINKKNKQLDEKGLRIAKLEGIIQEMEKHHGVLDGKIKLQVGNIEKTNFEMTVLMNQQKERLQKIKESDKQGIKKDFDNRAAQLRSQITDLNNLIQNLRAAYEAQKVKSRSLEKQLNDSLKKLDDKGILEEHVINIGLSNNYFKNIGEIFRKEV